MKIKSSLSIFSVFHNTTGHNVAKLSATTSEKLHFLPVSKAIFFPVLPASINSFSRPASFFPQLIWFIRMSTPGLSIIVRSLGTSNLVAQGSERE